MRRSLALLAACACLAGCGPKLDSELIAGRTVTVTNGEDGPVTLIKIVANDAGGRQECVNEPATTLGPGRTYTTTFFLCNEVKEVDIETDRGTREIGFE